MARANEKASAQGGRVPEAAKRAFMAFSLVVASSPVWPPDRNAIPGTAAGTDRSGVSTVVVEVAKSHNLSPLLMGWTVAALIRLATGSATVAMTTACGIVAPLAAAAGAKPELMVLSTGAGSLIFSHVNDGGFWLVKEYFHLTVAQTFMTWSVCETIISVVGLLLTLALAGVLPG